MSQEPTAPSGYVNPETVARPFARLGWIAFWLQLALSSLPILLMLYVVLRSPTSASGRGVDLREYVALGGLLVLLFTTWWCYRYTRIAKRMLDPESRPSSASVIRTLWIGVVASCLGAFISALLLLTAVVRLLIVFMLAPQGGVPVIHTASDDRARWVSALDMVDLFTMVLTITVELVVLAFSLWLLFKMIGWAVGYDRAAGGATALDEGAAALQAQ